MTRCNLSRWLIACLALLTAVPTATLAAADAQPASTLDWQPTIDDAKRLASQSNRLVLLHFSSPGCEACEILERDVFTNPRVQQQIQTRFVPFKINADDYPTTVKSHGIDRIPMHLVIAPTPGPRSVIVGRMQCPTTVDAYLNALAGIVPSPSNIAQAQPSSTENAAAPTPTVVGAPAGGNYASNNPGPSGFGVADQNSPNASTTNSAAGTGATSPYHAQPQGSPWQANASQPTSAQQMPQQQTVINASPDDRYAEVYRQMGAAPAASTQPNAAVVQTPNPAPQATTVNPEPTGAIVQRPASQPSWGTAGYLTPNQPSQGNAIVTPPPATQAAGGVANAPAPFGLEGYCPVTLAEKKVWQVGDRRWGAVHRGRTYLFAGPMEQKQFLSDPDRYSPAISGWDVVAAIDHCQTVDGQRQYGVTYQNRIYLFSSAASRQAFQQNPTRYAAEVRQAENPTRDTTIR